MSVNKFRAVGGRPLWSAFRTQVRHRACPKGANKKLMHRSRESPRRRGRGHGRDPKKDRLSWRRPALIKQGHGSYGIPIQSPSQSATVIWPAGRERTFFHFWCGHERSSSKWQSKFIFPADVHLTAFDGRYICQDGRSDSDVPTELVSGRDAGLRHPPCIRIHAISILSPFGKVDN